MHRRSSKLQIFLGRGRMYPKPVKKFVERFKLNQTFDANQNFHHFEITFIFVRQRKLPANALNIE